MSGETSANAGHDFTAIEQLPLPERAAAYRQQLEQLSRALDDVDEPLDFDELELAEDAREHA
ncbi:hypothetical protein [uncultured Gulosibacter sp.]|uniref:hypothetical protein n=1 Tax=uncultured Gulosibacter sp. TaxID=1339167 RepID=UPI00288A0B2D|nr:hypothetical protein [uncultured Gulosibacter sp.]